MPAQTALTRIFSALCQCQAAGNRPGGSVGHSVGETVCFAHEPLVRDVDYDGAASGLDDRRNLLPQGVGHAVDVHQNN